MAQDSDGAATLTDACEKLLSDSGGKKVLVFGMDGDVQSLAHAGQGGHIDGALGDQLASLIADVLQGASQRQSSEDLAVTLGGGLGACATAVGTRAALVVLFDGATTIERVRTKMKRAREHMLRLVESPQTGAHS